VLPVPPSIVVIVDVDVVAVAVASSSSSSDNPNDSDDDAYSLRFFAEGPSALYKGIVPTMLRQGCNQAVNFAAYNAMKNYWLERQREQFSLQHDRSLERDDISLQQGSQKIHQHQLSSAMSMLIGGLSGGMGPLVNNPLDVVKTRLQKQNITKYDTPKYTGLIQACFKIANEEGMGALWKGITPRLMRIVPGQAITFTTYEAVCRWL
jgi:solute carrier family 25 citrate transporter 1